MCIIRKCLTYFIAINLFLLIVLPCTAYDYDYIALFNHSTQTDGADSEACASEISQLFQDDPSTFLHELAKCSDNVIKQVEEFLLYALCGKEGWTQLKETATELLNNPDNTEKERQILDRLINGANTRLDPYIVSGTEITYSDAEKDTAALQTDSSAEQTVLRNPPEDQDSGVWFFGIAALILSAAVAVGVICTKRINK